MTKKQLALQAVEALKREYPDAICSLDYPDPLQLLICRAALGPVHRRPGKPGDPRALFSPLPHPGGLL